MEKEKRKRGIQQSKSNISYTLIGVGIIVMIVIIGFSIGASIKSPRDNTLRAMWKTYARQTADYKETHSPIIHVTQTVSAIQTQWEEINMTQTAISSPIDSQD